MIPVESALGLPFISYATMDSFIPFELVLVSQGSCIPRLPGDALNHR